MLLMKKKYVVLPLLLVFLSSLLAGCVEEYKTQTVKATVIEKDYDAPKTTYKTVKKNGRKTKKAVRESAEYEVTIQYKGIQKEFEDQSLYNQVKEGQEIKVHYVQGLDKNGKLVTEDIELID